MYCIYLHRNKINNKVYIGQTKFSDYPNKRWLNGKGYKENSSFYQDIQKYGWDNFDHIILANNLTLDESNRLEKQYIQEYNSTNPSIGYNSMPGGGNVAGKANVPIKIELQSFEPLYYNDSNGILRSRKNFDLIQREKEKYIEKYNKTRSCF